MRADFEAIYDNPKGTRRAIITRGRKNAKTAEAALILLLHLCGKEAIPNSQLFSAATSRDQAAVLFRLAAKIVRLNPFLNAAVEIKESAKELSCPALGTTYRALSADATTALGLSPALIVHDELGSIKGPRSALYEALETAVAAQSEPLSVIISTQAPTDGDLLSILIDDAKAGHDPRVVLRIDTAPEELDPFGEEAIRAANPAFDIFMNQTEVLAMAADASRMSSRESEYRNLVLNQRVEAQSPFISRNLWAACSTVPEPIDRVPVYAGLDLSATKDLTAFVMMGRINGIWHVHPAFWLPGEGLADKARADRVPYDDWHRQGFLNAAPGRSVDYEYVAEYLWGSFAHYNIQKVGFDRWAFVHLKPWLLRVGFTEDVIASCFVDFGQGTKSMTPALRDLESEINNQRIAHGNHPVLTMCANNAVVVGQDDARKLDKKKSSGRIDGMVALAMAFGVAPLKDETEPSKFQMMIL